MLDVCVQKQELNRKVPSALLCSRSSHMSKATFNNIYYAYKAGVLMGPNFCGKLLLSGGDPKKEALMFDKL